MDDKNEILAQKRIIGLDKLPTTGKTKRFAYCIINEFSDKEEEGYIELNELPSLLKEKDIDIIAIDNIFELYSSHKEIIEFMKKNSVKLIQVTGGFSSQKKLIFLAKTHLGIKATGHFSPEQAAEISAKLAYMGVGKEVHVFDDVTRIIISRNRVIGEGGQHQAKYARNIASIIMRIKREIEDKLRKNNLFYEVFAREGDFGIKGAKFLVYAPYEKVREIVKDYKGDLYQIKVSPITYQKIAFEARKIKEKGKNYLICGIDPGDTTGLAILDLNGKPLLIKSRKEWSLYDILDDIFQFGQPIIIATDVPKTPQTIEKLAKKTGSIIFKPKRMLSIAEKHELVRQLGLSVKNAHERDALSAAYLAYKRYRNVLEKVDNILSFLPIKIDSQEVKKEVIFGHSIKESVMNHLNAKIEEYVEKRLKKYIDRIKNKIAVIDDKNEEMRIVRKKLSELKKELLEKEKKIDELIRERNTLKTKIDELYEENLYLKDKIRKLEASLNNLEKSLNGEINRESEEKKEIDRLREIIKIKDRLIKELKKENNKLRLLVSRSKWKLPIKVLKKLTTEEITYVDEVFGISPGDIVYIVDPAGSGRKAALELIKRGIIGVIVGKINLPKQVIEEFEKANVPILDYDKISEEIIRIDDTEELMFLDKKIFDKLVKTEKATVVEKEEYDDIEELIRRYRARRKKEIHS